MALKDKIDLFRCQSGLTIDELAAKSGISISTIKKISAGITKDPQIETLRAIACAMGKTLSDFDDDYTIEKSVGRRIKARRKALGMNAEKLALLIGISPATVYRFEKGDIEKISCTLLEPIANALNTSVAYLMGWTDNPDEHALFVGQRLKELRVSAGLSVDELVERIEKNRATIYRYESGEIDDIPASVIVKLANAFHVSPAYVMGWSDNPDGHVDSATKLDSEENTPENTDHTADTLAVQKAMIAGKIKDLRISKGLTQQFVAEALGKKQQTVASWERGQSQPDISTLLQFCNMCGVSVDSAFGRNVDDNLSLSEKQLIQQYRSLDAHGKHVVDTVLRLEVEHERSGQAEC